MANIYNKVPVKVQKKSGFDKSFQNLFTSKVGTITPILCDEVIPNSTINLRVAMSAALPPLASDTFMRCKLKYAAFFVPTRLLLPAGAYERWLTGDDDYITTSDEDGVSTASGKITMPVLQLHHNSTLSDNTTRVAVPGTLSDFLGVKMTSSAVTGSTGWTMDVSALPYLGYHKIYNDWFRNSLVQKDIFAKGQLGGAAYYNVATSLNFTPNSNAATNYILTDTSKTAVRSSQSIKFCDGVLLTELRQANFDIDLFTSSTPQAQNGAAQSVSFNLQDSTGGTLTETGFTISALRAANSIQQWLERNNLAGNRMVDYVKANYGANLSDYIAQRPVLLGSGAFDVFSKGIYQTGMDNSVGYTQNPFSSVGSRYGSAFIDGNDLIIKNFTAAEPGYIYVLVWLSPRVTYSTGIDPLLARYTKASTQSQMANPILQNVGNEPIYSWQLCDTVNKVGTPNVSAATIFGYNDRYYAWKDKVDEVHGLLRDQGTLQSFALQRTFTNAASANSIQISSDFLKIPTTYLDQVAAVSGDISKYGYWCDTYMDYKVSMPLAKYSIPSLQDPAYEHGDDIMIDRSGRQLA